MKHGCQLLLEAIEGIQSGYVFIDNELTVVLDYSNKLHHSGMNTLKK